MITFVWSSRYPLMAGTGGSENYTVGQVRELMSRGIDTRIVTVGFGEEDGRIEFPDIDFMSIEDPSELEELDDTIVFVSEPMDIQTKNKSFVILHVPPHPFITKENYEKMMKGKVPIVTSHFAASEWVDTLGCAAGDIEVVYPFALHEFSQVERVTEDTTRVLYAGRLTPEKGVYTLLWALHDDSINGPDFEYTVTNAGAHTPDGTLIHQLLTHHPKINLISARKTPGQMAELMANTDILVMPSSELVWKEMFGILSIEAQHAGVRVVASDSGGLPETDCGSLILIKPDNPEALVEGILEAKKLGPVSPSDREKAECKFTVKDSVDKLLHVIEYS
jgi:D-inositol-3-phosphate glycosyltransferase